MKNKLILSLVVLMVAVSVLAVSAQDVATFDDTISKSASDDDDALSVDNSDDAVYRDGEGSGNAKDVWIDNTVDNSMVYINGELRVIDSSNSTILLLPLSNSTCATFSTANSIAKDFEIQTVNNAINYVKKLLNAKDVKIFSGASSNVTKVYDHRKYETVEDNDAQLIGDADYLIGAYGLSTTRTHIASGDYGKIVNITLDFIVKATFDETEDAAAEPAETQDNSTADNTTNTTTNTTSSTDVKNVNSSDNVTNNTHIKPKDVAKATGIPFAVLIVALLGIGVSIRRRK